MYEYNYMRVSLNVINGVIKLLSPNKLTNISDRL